MQNVFNRRRNFDAPVLIKSLESHVQSRTFEMEDAQEEISDLLEKREPESPGSIENKGPMNATGHGCRIIVLR